MAETTYTFKIPEKLAKQYGVQSITIKEMKAELSMELLKKFSDDFSGYQMAKIVHCITEIDGKPVSYIEAQTFYQNCAAKISDLVQRAYQSVNLPTEAEVSDFLGSATVTVN